MHQRRVFYYATDDYGYAHAHSAAAVAANYSRGYHTHDNGTDASGWKSLVVWYYLCCIVDRLHPIG
jgi:hypothetical protein